jgi:hypothetical protein
LRELGQVLGVAQKAQVVGPGGFERGEALYQHIRVAEQLGIDRPRQGLNDTA